MKTYQKIYYMHTVLFFVRTHVNIKMFPDHHIHHSEVCRERTTQIIEFDASKVVVEIDQYVDDVSFDGAYVFLQGSYESGEHCTAQLNEMLFIVLLLKVALTVFDCEYMKSYI